MIDVEKLKRWHEAANSKSMHPEDVAAARFQLGQFAKGPEFAAILAMAEREKRMREALEWYEAAVSAFPLNTANGDKAYDELEADAGQTARRALGEEKAS